MDREKVINGLENTEIMLQQAIDRGGEMAVMGAFKCLNSVIDALAMLKEQKSLEPYACEGDMMCGNGCEIVGYIRESDGKIERLSNYCPHCGRPVKWD